MIGDANLADVVERGGREYAFYQLWIKFRRSLGSMVQGLRKYL